MLIRMSSTRALLLATIVGALLTQPVASSSLHAQQPAQATINQVPLSVGRALPISSSQPITRVSVVNPEIADVALLSDRELVINAHSIGETDIVFWPEGGAPVQYRVQVTDRPDRSQVLLNVKVAEVRRDLLREIGFSGLFRDNNTRVGTGNFNTDNVFDEFGNIVLPPETGFGTFLSDFGTTDFLALIEAEATRGNARILAQPNLLAANRDSANFLVGGEFPVPVVQGGGSEDGGIRVTIQFREFGVRLGLPRTS